MSHGFSTKMIDIVSFSYTPIANVNGSVFFQKVIEYNAKLDDIAKLIEIGRYWIKKFKDWNEVWLLNWYLISFTHYSDVMMSAMASQITGVSSVC